MSLEEVYEIGYKHAVQNIRKNGGEVKDDKITLPRQVARPVKFEKSFAGLYPATKLPVRWSDNRDEISFEFEGTGFVVRGETARWASNSTYHFNTELYLDDMLVEKIDLPTAFTTRRYELAWKYELPKGKHRVRLKILNPSKEQLFNAGEVIIYTDRPAID
jgi:hypothetical protein